MSSEKLRTEATRYPDGLPDIIPSEAFGKEDADTAIGIATDILGLVNMILSS
jgi:HEPN domain-containing protein